MFKTTFKGIFIAGALALGAVATSTGSANADIRGGLYIYGADYQFGVSSRHRGYESRRGYRRVNRCSPRKAVRKARRRGLRRAHVVRVNRRGVIVAGRKWGERVVMGFDRNRRCHLRFVRAR